MKIQLVGTQNSDGSTCPSPRPSFTTQSGFGFNGANSQEILPGAIINLGVFRHHNNPVYADYPLQSVDLTITLYIAGVSPNPTFTYTMNLDETSNSGACSGSCCPSTNCCYWYNNDWRCRGTCTITCTDYSYWNPPPAQYICCGESGDLPACCAYTPCNSPCPDKVSWANTATSTTFTIDGKVYTLEILGFADCSNPNAAINQFITQEGQDNYACLYGRITGNTPSIHVEKYTNNIDVESASDPDRPIISSGCPVTWTYKVTNDGNVPLSLVDVVDSVSGVTPVGVDVNPADGFNDGDLNKDGILDLTELWTYTATGTAISCPSPGCECDYTNTATATAMGGTTPVSDTDPSYYHAIQTSVNAGQDQSICEYPGTVPLLGSSSCAPSGVTYQWTTSGTGTFADATALSTTYTIGTGDLPSGQDSGQVTLTLTATGTCTGTTVSDSMVVTIVKKPNILIVVLEPQQP